MSKPSTVALHEAAHAVVAYLSGVRVLEVVITGEGTGFCNVSAVGRKACVIVDACITIAGHEAEVLWCGRDVTIMPLGDLTDLSRMKLSWTGCGIVRRSVSACLKNWKRTVWEVARELDNRGRLTERRFVGIIKTRVLSRPGVLVRVRIK